MRFTLPAHLFGRRPAATLLAAALLATSAALTHSLLPNGAVSAETDTAGICDRTQEVHEAILDKLTGISDCADVTNSDLSGITGEIVILDNESISLPDGDFQGLSNLEVLYISHNGLGALPQDVLDGRDKLDRLILTSNNLSGLPEGVFDGLTEIETLYMGNNEGLLSPSRPSWSSGPVMSWSRSPRARPSICRSPSPSRWTVFRPA